MPVLSKVPEIPICNLRTGYIPPAWQIFFNQLDQITLGASVNPAIASTAGGTYTAAEQAMLNDIKALLNQIRAALVANGIMV